MVGRPRWILAVAIAAAALSWGALIVAAPVWARAPGAKGTAGLAVYALADRVCHQIPDRTFAIAARPMPVCARCAGLYLSGAAGALFALGWTVVRRRGSADDAARWRWIVIAGAVPTGLSWLAEVSGVAEPSLLVRAVCALPLGAATGWVSVRAALGALR